MMKDVDPAAKAMREEEMQQKIEDFHRRLQPADLSWHEDRWRARGYVVKPARLERRPQAQGPIGDPVDKQPPAIQMATIGISS
jgi:hypothetical protein